ncbi:MAG TPA: radical SAM protein [Bacteroidia bacterium]|nr:radical SAM protein [Bacteroidia bacterium]
MKNVITESPLQMPLPSTNLPKRYFKRMVLQPTSLCNLNCSYCYLAERTSNHRMPIEVAQSIANEFRSLETPITIIWHGGEPLATGLSHFEKLLKTFNGTKVRHAIQTNATLINDKWCHLFKKYSVSIGISIDGQGKLNSNRVDFSGKETISKVENGIALLRKHDIDFGIIAVVNNTNIDNATSIYEYAIKLGAHSLAINIEEIDGVNTRIVPDDVSVTKFWKELWTAWSETPTIRIREFEHISYWISSTLSSNTPSKEYRVDLFPTISWNGDVVFLSPELHSLKHNEFNNFIAGNVLHTPLFDLMKEISPKNSSYVLQYLEGVEMCKNTCAYFQYCRGGHASNKYAEHRKLNVTETISCRNSRKRLVNAILDNEIEPRNYLELNSLIDVGITKKAQLKSLISSKSKKLELSGLGAEYDKFSDWDKWDDFDRINFSEYDDDGNQTGIEIGGH